MENESCRFELYHILLNLVICMVKTRNAPTQHENDSFYAILDFDQLI